MSSTNVVEDDSEELSAPPSPLCDTDNKTTQSTNIVGGNVGDDKKKRDRTDETWVDGEPREKQTTRLRRWGHEALPLEFWERSAECKEAKNLHIQKIDEIYDGDREGLIMSTTLKSKDTVLEPNMFPYSTPSCIEHWTLWSVNGVMTQDEIIEYVDDWLHNNMPNVKRWEWDENEGQFSFFIFHVHIFIEIEPYAFRPTPEDLYMPPRSQKDAAATFFSDKTP
jgi:hypothetical protein